MFTLDNKITIWERVTFETEEEMLKIKALLESGELKTMNDVCEYTDKGVEYLYDTTEDMTVEENNGMQTMELLNEEGNAIWTNNGCNPYICGSCGEFVPKVTFNEPKDIDECDDCKS